MADWMHKERTWIWSQEYSWDKPEASMCGFEEDGKNFVEWLDYQCQDGWEVCNISIINIESNFDDSGLGKLCIFRKKN
jgi:hypothetical protein